MKWIRQDAFGNETVWYSEDVILRIREWATAEILAKKYGAIHKGDACETILNFLNEVDNEST